jgi:L-iditol 2-dehydrogenase
MISKNHYVKSSFLIDVRTETVSDPPHGHYLIQLEACGVCHSDLIWASHRSGDWEKIGHEFGGRIVRCGKAALRFSEGQRVAVRNASVCGQCPPCREDRPRFCQDVIMNKSGHDQYFMADERSLVDAEGLTASMLGIVEPLGVANDIVATAEVSLEDTVIIYGLGVIGLMAGRLCMQRGASVVIGIARHSGRFALAKEFGFTACFESQSANLEESVEQVAGGLSSKILVCAPPECLNDAISLLQPEGLIVMAGLNEGGWNIHTSFNFETLILKRASIRGAFAYPNLYFESAIEQLRNDGEVLSRVISHVEPLSKLRHMLKQIQTIPHAYLKVVLMP